MRSSFSAIDLRLIVLLFVGSFIILLTFVSRLLGLSLPLSGALIISAGFVLLGAFTAFVGKKESLIEHEGGELILGEVVSSKAFFKIFIDKFRHILVTGITGCGKSTFIRRMIQQILKSKSSFLYVDFKGEQADYDEILSIAESEGIVDLLIFDLSDPDNCIPINFLTLFEGIPETVGLLTELLIESDSPSYFKNEAARFLKCSLRLLDGAGHTRTFVAIEEIYQSGKKRAELLRDYASRNSKEDSCTRYFKEEFNPLKPKDRSERFSGFISVLSAFNEEPLRKIFNPVNQNQLGLAQILEGNQSAIIRVPGEIYGEMSSKIIQAFLKSLPPLIAKRRSAKDRKPYFLLLDEACSYLNKSLNALLKKAGSANIKILLTRMCDADFEAVDPSLLGQMLSTFSIYFCFQTHDPDTRETMSRLSMTIDDEKFTRKVGSEGETGEGSVRDVHKFRIHPTEFGKLNPGECYAISPSLNIFEKIRVLQTEVAA